MNTIIEILLIGWFVTRFEPLKELIGLIPKNLITSIISLNLNCIKCFCFWFGLIWTGDIFISIVASFIAFWYDHYIGQEEKSFRL